MGGHASHYKIRSRNELTPRQREVLAFIAAGKTNPEIAELLGISLEGAKHHVSEILGKLEVSSREEAAEWWRLQGRHITWAKLFLPLGAVLGTAAAALVGLALVFGDGDQNGEPRRAAASAVALRPCRSGNVDMQVEPADAAVLFTITVESPDAPCQLSTDVNLLPVPAAINEDPRFALPIDTRFSTRTLADIEPGPVPVASVLWTNWCESPRAMAWRVMTTLPAASASESKLIHISDLAPKCVDRSAGSKLERMAVQSVAPTGTVRLVQPCSAEDIEFELYEEAPWRPQAVLLEVRPSATSCFVDGEVSAELVVDGVSVGRAAIPLRSYLGPIPFRAPFRWQGACDREDVVLWVRLAGASAELRPSVRPLCDPPAAEESFGAGWP